MRINLNTILFLLATTAVYSPVDAEYYRWIDKSGEIHFGDKVPTSENYLGREKINERGRVVETVGRAKTAEEIIIVEEEQRLAEVIRQQEEEQAAYDHALLATFSSIEDMQTVRDERVALIDQTIELSRGRLRKQERELAKLGESRKRFVNRNQNAPPWIERNEQQVLEQISSIEEYIFDQELEKEDLRQHFNRDINRFSELTRRDITVR